VPANDREVVDQCWRDNNLEGKKVIGIHLGGKLPVQRWPVANFESLGKEILELGSDYRIVVVGGKEEQDTGNDLIRAWQPGAVNLAGKSTLLQSAEILRRCDLYVGNDSGPMHLAVAVGTPVVGIFSSYQFPVFWKPWGQKSRIVRHSVPCEFCFPKDGNCPKGTYECIKGVTVDEVFDACLTYLNAQVRQAGLLPLKE
jgi:ADP-heptose:LPS heptosyltransferase